MDSGAAVMQEELGAIRGLVERVLQGQAATPEQGGAAPIADDVLDVYTSLIGQEVSDELARDVIESVSSELSGDELRDPATVRRCLVKHLSEFIPVSGGSLLAASPDERPLTLALVGPTGVGKNDNGCEDRSGISNSSESKRGLDHARHISDCSN